MKFIFAALILLGISAQGELLCLKMTKRGKFKVVATNKSKCPKGNLLDTDSVAGNPGSKGINGSDGLDATEEVYGDESAGDLIINSSTTFSNRNPQFRNVTINAGNTLTVPSGTTIRATGTCIINGSIVVEKGAYGGRSNGLRHQPANFGLAYSPPGLGEYGDPDNTNALRGGSGGVGISESTARMLVKLTGTAYGSAGESNSSVAGGSGGGGFALYCKGAVIIQGSISADGGNGFIVFGTGGGSGGLIVIASKESIVSTGTISAIGGNGSNWDYAIASAGGGGGGGVIHLLAPHIIEGTTDVSGGDEGSIDPADFLLCPCYGGSGGGGFGGDGGRGGHVNLVGNPQSAQPGTDGFVITTLTDPSALLF